MNASLRILSAGAYAVRMVRVSTGLIYYPLSAGGNVIAYEVPPGFYYGEAQNAAGDWIMTAESRKVVGGGYYTVTVTLNDFVDRSAGQQISHIDLSGFGGVFSVGSSQVNYTWTPAGGSEQSTSESLPDYWMVNFQIIEAFGSAYISLASHQPWPTGYTATLSEVLTSLDPLPWHDLLSADSVNSQPNNQNQQFRHMKTSGVISLLEAKTSADMVAFGESLVAPTVKTGDLLALAKQAAARGEMDNPCLAILDFRAQNDLVRATIIERAAANAAAVDGFRDSILDGFADSEESVAAKYTLELTNGVPKLPGYFTPDDVTANADPLVAIMNAAFLQQRDLLYQRAVPQEDGTGDETEVLTRKKFTPDSIIARAISLAEKDARFADVLGLVVIVDEYAKAVHVLFLKAPGANLTAFDWRDEALPVGPSAITLEVEIEPEAAPAATPFNFLA